MFLSLTIWTARIRSLLFDSVQSLLAIDRGTALAMIAIVVGSLVALSLLTQGKNGRGWRSICLVGHTLSFFGHVLVSVFREVSANNEVPSDWDSD